MINRHSTNSFKSITCCLGNFLIFWQKCFFMIRKRSIDKCTYLGMHYTVLNQEDVYLMLHVSKLVCNIRNGTSGKWERSSFWHANVGLNVSSLQYKRIKCAILKTIFMIMRFKYTCSYTPFVKFINNAQFTNGHSWISQSFHGGILSSITVKICT